MSIGLVGRKIGMTRIFTESGDTLPVTVLDVSDNRITQIKSPDRDGYAAVQVTFGKRRASRVGKPLAGHMAKAGVEAGHILKEFRANPEELASLKVGGKMGTDTSTIWPALNMSVPILPPTFRLASSCGLARNS